MAGPRPQDDYNPNNSVAPSTAAPNDYLQVRANPGDFGAQIGQANQGLGKTLEQGGNQAIDYAIQAQGLANEHAANAAEQQLAVEGGKIYDQYKSLEGLSASTAKDKYVSDYLNLSNKIREGLGNPGAQRSYDQMATRRLSFTIQDMNSYAATEQKKAYRKGNADGIKLSTDDAGRYEVASNPQQLGYTIGTAVFNLNAVFTAPQYGYYSDLKATTNKDGTLSFDQSDDRGRLAQLDYDTQLNTVKGQAYENAYTALVNDPNNGSIKKGEAFLKDNYNKIPRTTYAKLAHASIGPIRQEDARELTQGRINSLEQTYNQTISQPPQEIDMSDKLKGLFPGITVTSQQRTPEHNAAVGGVPDSQHLAGTATDIVLPKGVSFDDFKSSLAVNGIKTTELLNEGDHVHIAWGSKAPVGLENNFTSKADMYRQNYADVLKGIRDDAEKIHPGDQQFADLAAKNMEQRMNDVIHQQDLSVRSDQDAVVQAIHPKNGIPLTSIDQITNGPPDVRKAWENWQNNDPYAPVKLNNLLTANSRGQATTYGTQFWDWYSKAVKQSIHDPTELLKQIEPSAGKDSPLTNLGAGVLGKMLKDGQTPEGRAFQQSEFAFFDKLRNDKIGNSNARGDEKFTEFMMRTLPMIEGAHSRKENIVELYDPKSPKYLGKELDAIYPPSKRLADFQEHMEGKIDTGRLGQTGPKEYNSLDELKKDLSEKKVTRAFAIQYAISKKWAQASGPAVPRPTD